MGQGGDEESDGREGQRRSRRGGEGRGGIGCRHVRERASGSGRGRAARGMGGGLVEMSDEFDPSVYDRCM